MKISKSIFKAYDIRGIFEKELFVSTAKEVARSISNIYNQNNCTIVIGRDGRLSSKKLSDSLIEGFLESGKDIIDIGEVPTPVLYFAVNFLKLNSGIMVTGSHNPKQYNGFKIIMNGHALAGEEIQEIYNKILSNNTKSNYKNNTHLKKINIINEYEKKFLESIKIDRKLKIAVDAGNGAAGPTAIGIYKKLGLELIELYCSIDGNFPNHQPNPSDPNNLVDLIFAVNKNNCDLGIAFDGDGDRCLIIDNEGNILWPDRQMMLYSKDILAKERNAKIVYDVKSSKDLPQFIKKYGGEPVMCRTGHSFIKSKMKEINATLGGEMSGHIFFKDKWYGFDDGIYCGARMLEIVSNQKLTSNDLFSSLPFSYSTPEINIPVEKDGIQHEFMKKFIKNAKFSSAEISKIDGLRADFKNGWGLIRASNTTPCLVMRFEANTECELEAIKNNFKNEIKRIDSTFEI